MVGIEGVHESSQVAVGNEALLHHGAVAHDGENPRGEELRAVHGAGLGPHGGTAARPEAERPFLHRDAVVQHVNDDARVQLVQVLQDGAPKGGRGRDCGPSSWK